MPREFEDADDLPIIIAVQCTAYHRKAVVALTRMMGTLAKKLTLSATTEL